MRTLSSQDLTSFEQQGYLFLKNVFSCGEILTIRKLVNQARERVSRDPERDPPSRSALVELSSVPELAVFDYIVFNQRVVECARQLLGDRVAYFGDSFVNVGS